MDNSLSFPYFNINAIDSTIFLNRCFVYYFILSYVLIVYIIKNIKELDNKFQLNLNALKY